MNIVFILHLFSSLFMVGVCWFVQIVHYPLFHQIKLEEFPDYERKNFVTGFVTVPAMTTELITGLILLYHLPNTLHFLNIGLLGLIWLSTAVFQVPIHLRLTRTATVKLIDKLILTNWIRTISWTVRMVILAMILSDAIK